MLDNLLVLVLAWYGVFLFSTTLHEAAHAWIARRLGDPTAYAWGFATLDPTPHIRRSPFGMLIIPLVSCFYYQGGWLIGWASVPYNPLWANRNPRAAALMSAAGPLSNLLLATVAFLVLKIGINAGYFGAGTGGVPAALSLIAYVTLKLNIVMFFLNMMPLPPFDGSGIISLFLTRSQAVTYHRYMWNPNYQMLGLVVTWHVMGRILGPVFGWVRGQLLA